MIVALLIPLVFVVKVRLRGFGDFEEGWILEVLLPDLLDRTLPRC